MRAAKSYALDSPMANRTQVASRAATRPLTPEANAAKPRAQFQYRPRGDGMATPHGKDDGASSIFVTAQDGLKLHVRSYGRRAEDLLPLVCLPGLARTAADF